MPSVDRSILTKIAVNKLEGARPKNWDTDARELYDAIVKASHPNAEADTINASWRDAMAYMRDNHKDDWDAYAKHKKRPEDLSATPWEKVKLVKGQADGDTFELFFEVDGLKCVIECSDIQLLDPTYIQRKLVMYTRKDVICPYLGKKQLEAWRRDVVLPWLTSDAFKHIERETIANVVEGLIEEFCTDTLASETGPEVWMQLKRAVSDQGVVYVPFPGLQDFIRRRAGDDPTKRTIKNTLSRLGFTVAMKGKNRLRFHSIPIAKLYEKTDSGETGGGEVNADRPDSTEHPVNGRDGIFNELREEERKRSEVESGEWPATAETQGGTSDVPDDSFDAVQGD